MGAAGDGGCGRGPRHGRRRPSGPSLFVAAPARRLAQRLVGSAALAAVLLSPRAAMAHVVSDQPPATAPAAVAAPARRQPPTGRRRPCTWSSPGPGRAIACGTLRSATWATACGGGRYGSSTGGGPSLTAAAWRTRRDPPGLAPAAPIRRRRPGAAGGNRADRKPAGSQCWCAADGGLAFAGHLAAGAGDGSRPGDDSGCHTARRALRRRRARGGPACRTPRAGDNTGGPGTRSRPAGAGRRRPGRRPRPASTHSGRPAPAGDRGS